MPTLSTEEGFVVEGVTQKLSEVLLSQESKASSPMIETLTYSRHILPYKVQEVTRGDEDQEELLSSLWQKKNHDPGKKAAEPVVHAWRSNQVLG